MQRICLQSNVAKPLLTRRAATNRNPTIPKSVPATAQTEAENRFAWERKSLTLARGRRAKGGESVKSRTPYRITKPNPAYTPPPAKPCGVDPASSDFGALCTCAVRYCIGRRTYMPSLIASYLTPLIPKLETRTLVVIAADIRGAANLGDACDAEAWNRFLSAVETEITKRRGSS